MNKHILPQSPIQHGKQSKHIGLKTHIRNIIIMLTVLAVSGVALTLVTVFKYQNTLQTNSVKLETQPSPEPEVVSVLPQDIQPVEGEFAMFLAGTDTRNGQLVNDGEEGNLNDVNILVYVDAQHQKMTAVSFPRDLMVAFPSCTNENGETTPAYDEKQINEALNVGGLACATKVVEQLTGISIPYAGLIDFNGVIDITERIGGVNVCLTTPIYNWESGELAFPAGENNLQGVNALTFLRERKGVGNGSDIGRINNQQVFLTSMIRQVFENNTFADPFQMIDLANIVSENIQLSESLTKVPKLLSIAKTVQEIGFKNINFAQYPTYEHPDNRNRLTTNVPEASSLIQNIITPPVVEQVPEPVPSDTSTPVPTTNEPTEILPDKPCAQGN